ncbi:MAG: Fis family transcriptional regulator [Candidatus Rokuibacteriota bacterium]|nr:MAG: Fis family transcriptional regulator [Candidatus Rokubacteria bacterium]
MTLGILHALKGQRSVEDLLRALPSALRPLLAFDRVSLAWDRSVSGTLWWHELDAECAISRTDDEVPADLTALGLLSTCAVPLTTPHRALGTLEIASRRANAYSDDDVDLLAIVADAVAVTLDNALSHEQLREEHDRLTLLLELTNSLVSNLELRDVLTAVMRSARRIMRSDSAVVALPDADAGHLRAYALDIQDGGDLLQEGELIDAQGTIAAQVFRTGKPWVGRIEDVLESGLEVNPKWLELGFKVGCVLPLASRHRILGTLGLRRRDDTMYTDDEVNFLIQVANQIAVAVENALAYGEIRSLKDKLAEERVYLRDEVRTERNFEEVVGKSTVLRRVLRNVETVAPTDSTVLIYGETGTGKELIARAIHNLSPRRSKAFVKLNCAAIPTGLLESELFGHEKGAFTGAIAQRIGRFELADGGTIFLDEVGEIPLDLQTKLLRVLQEREFERLGSGRTLRTDARLIAATNRDLAALVEEKRFRADLFYRLNVFPVHMPPLHERPEDIPLLVRHFVEHYARRMKRAIETIPSETMEVLTRYRWPGNVRELQNLMERAVILSPGPVLHVPLGDLDVRATGGQPRGPAQTLEEAERAHIVATLTDTNWVVAGARGAAVRLGMNRSTLQFRMKKLGIMRPKM